MNAEYDYLTYAETLAKAKEFYPEAFFQGHNELKALEYVQTRLLSLAKCDDLTKDEQFKVNVLLPNINECLT